MRGGGGTGSQNVCKQAPRWLCLAAGVRAEPKNIVCGLCLRIHHCRFGCQLIGRPHGLWHSPCLYLVVGWIGRCPIAAKLWRAGAVGPGHGPYLVVGVWLAACFAVGQSAGDARHSPRHGWTAASFFGCLAHRFTGLRGCLDVGQP